MSSITKPRVEDLEARLEFLNSEVNRVETVFSQKEELSTSLDQEIRDKEARLKSFDEALTIAEAKVSVVIEELESLHKEKSARQSDVNRLLEEAKLVANECQKWRGEVDAKKAEFAVLDGKIAQKNIESDNKSKDVIDAKAALKQAWDVFFATQQQMVTRGTSLESKEKELSTRENRIETNEIRLDSIEKGFKQKEQALSQEGKRLDEREKEVIKRGRELDETTKALFSRDTGAIDRKFSEREDDIQKKDKLVTDRERDLIKREREYLIREEDLKVKERIMKIREKATGLADISSSL